MRRYKVVVVEENKLKFWNKGEQRLANFEKLLNEKAQLGWKYHKTIDPEIAKLMGVGERIVVVFEQGG